MLFYSINIANIYAIIVIHSLFVIEYAYICSISHDMQCNDNGNKVHQLLVIYVHTYIW